jgi:ribosomal protein S2
MKAISKNIISVCGHIGTHKFNWQPESERFAIGYRSNIVIYNLASTTFYINRAMKFVEKLIIKFGRIYFYGLDSYKDKKFVIKYATINQVVAHKRWKGGFVTNVRRFKSKIKNARKRFSAIVSFNYGYDNYSLPREAFLVGLPSVGVVDSNVKAENFSYPIPINSDNFAITRTIAYNFGLQVFKGISKRIISRFSKKLKIIKIKKFRKKKRMTKLYITNKKNINPVQLLTLAKKMHYFKKRVKWYNLAEEVYNNYITKKKNKSLKIKLYALGFPVKKPWQMNRKKWIKKKILINHVKKKKTTKIFSKQRFNKKVKFKRKIRIKSRRYTTRYNKLKSKIRKLYKVNKFKNKFIKLMELNPRSAIRNFKMTIKLYKYNSLCSYLYRAKRRYESVKKLGNIKKKIEKASKSKLKKHRYYYHNFNSHKKKKKPFFFRL